MADDFSLLTPEFRADPYPYYRRLRADDPVFFLEPPGLWGLTRYADVLAALHDTRLSAERFQLTLPELRSSALISSLSRMMLLRDPPDHTRLRLLVSKAFTPRVVEGLRGRIQRIVDESIAAVAGRGHLELMRDIAAPLPVVVIAELMGLPVHDREQLKRWSDDLMTVADGSVALAGFPRAEQSASEFKAYLNDVLVQRRADPRDDLISAMLAARDAEDQLDDDELFASCVLLLIAGHETTTNLIGNGVLTLLRHPAELARLRADPSLIRTAIEELLRYESPVQLTSRMATVDFEIGGKPVRAGQEVCLMLAAANRDPEQFPDPDTLDLGRIDNAHLAFGHGTHFCLGASLARLEGQIAIHTLITRLPGIRLTTDTLDWREGIMMRGLTTLPLAF